ncbi:tumor necrosis factor receptor superfamily member 11A [Pyxicephalus adspersus]|uniref:tumor necrosis factor receptor superfamily member 11A n=1 Tax=Pyxicephalus adspersus TaxID=30357 RepID=UPI003B5B3DAF
MTRSMEGLVKRLWTILILCVTFWSFGAETKPQCDPEKEYEHSKQCCKKCEPGTHMVNRCTSSSNTVCSSCGPNEYMSVWNDELKCALHMVCDAGKALQELHKGNRTYPRVCVCTNGYHFDTSQEICMENTNCPPAFGVQVPVQQNKNTVCIPCQEGYFSNTSSSTERCQPWTNCSEFGLLEIRPGTNLSDVVCGPIPKGLLNEPQMIILITVLIVSLTVILFVCVLCYMKKYSTIKASVQEWVQETSVKLCGSEKKSHYKEANTIGHNYIIIPNATLVENINSDNLKEIEILGGRSVPTEDEYMDQRGSPEPENGNMVAGMEPLLDLENISLGTFNACSDTSSDRLLCPNEEGIIPPCPEYHCNQSAKDTSRKRREEHCIPDQADHKYGQHSSRHGVHINAQTSYHIPDKNTDREPCSCSTSSQYTRSSSRNSSDTSFPETPSTPSGNVTGNNNTTVISSAPVMNIKTDVVVVYYRGSSQEAHIPCESEENIKRPMQEERRDHNDTFVANVPPYKYSDIPCCSVPDTNCSERDSTLKDSSCPVMSSKEDLCDIFCQNTDFLPVQEEGKPEF